MVDCTEVTELLGPFRDGELDPHQVTFVARHLSTCTRCEVLLSEICDLGETLRASVCEPCLDGFTENVLKRVALLHEPLYRRLRRQLAALNWDWPIAVTSASMATALASWLALITFVNPVTAPNEPAASSGVTEVAGGAQQFAQPLGLAVPYDASQTRDQVIISRLETDRRHVALWSEPEGRTTVIWLPEETELGE
jgi:anti-sigma factor RsiW